MTTALARHAALTLVLIAWVGGGLGVAADSPTPKRERKTLIVLGDSLAAGLGVDPSEAFPALLEKKIGALGWNVEVVNAGVSGDTSAGGVRRIEWVLRRKIDLLLIELGGNDGLRGLTPMATRTNLQAIIDRARVKYPQAKMVLAGMRMPPNMGQEYTEAFEKVFPELAEKNGLTLVPFLLEGVGGKPELNLPDGIHPTPEGHKILAENVWKVLRPLLEKMPGVAPMGAGQPILRSLSP